MALFANVAHTFFLLSSSNSDSCNGDGSNSDSSNSESSESSNSDILK